MASPAHELRHNSLYNPSFERDGCGIGFVTRIDGTPGHDILTMALDALANLAHRGAVADDAKTGDGAGVLTQLPKALLLRELAAQGITAEAHDLALGMFFLPADPAATDASCAIVAEALVAHGLALLAWRDVPTNPAVLGLRAREAMPTIRQAIVARSSGLSDNAFERTLFLARKRMEQGFKAAQLAAYVPSLSSRTVIYKGLLLGAALRDFYSDLIDPAFTTAIAVYHQRYSTNTFPSWELAQPFRMLSHNGEINTVQGNANWMRAREAALELPVNWVETKDEGRKTNPGNDQPSSFVLGPSSILPVLDEAGSDSAMLDNALELVVQAGRDIRHAVAMLVPEAWEKIPDMPSALHSFYKYHACLIEPWDGPAALAFSDGRVVGSALDRNGLRPARYIVTDDGLVISGSEVGAVPVDEARIVHKGKLGPGQMIAVDTVAKRLFIDEEIKEALAAQQPYEAWLKQHLKSLVTSDAQRAASEDHDSSLATGQSSLQMAFGYTSEELAVVLKPMLSTGQEPVGSMGDDTPPAVFSQLELGRPLFHFFKQRFAEVTNPPIDSLREEQVMSLSVAVGQRRNLLAETPEHAHLLQLESPILSNAQLAALRSYNDPMIKIATVQALMPLNSDLGRALAMLCAQAQAAAEAGAGVLIISDKGVDAEHAPIPSLLAVGAVHHHLIRSGWRSRLSLLLESGEPREVHHLACLVGYGAEAVNPYLAFATARQIASERDAVKNKGEAREAAAPKSADPRSLSLSEEAEHHYIHALEKGLLKIMSKMGISTFDSYCGAQIFEAVGLDQALVETCFTGTPSRVGGVTVDKLEQDVRARHKRAFGEQDAAVVGRQSAVVTLPHPGFYKFKKDGEYHAFSPTVVHALHKAVQSEHALNGDSHATISAEGYGLYQAYANLIHGRPPTEPRDLLELVAAPTPIPLDEVEPIESIVRRFSTAAMSHGSTSSEAHETLSIAMNRLGGMANSGEGGEAPERYRDERNSRIKQVASGRFGVTPAYLTSASELQIKMAQGAKPGEGGQLPGHKVNAEIASIRHTVPGVALISPPPHHDIYSIEDLAQLIYDLKQVNPRAFVSVKLVATAGVGTVAAGVAKGYADVILISGHSGGTGASPLSSIKNAGIPWELGLAETQQTLVINGLRGRVRLRADGGLKTGRDVVIAALLGADEFSFGTAALVAEGCIMARACHANTCPVGIATQKAELRAKFPGRPEMIMAFLRYLAQEVREILASLGLRSIEEAVGRTDLLRQKASGLHSADLLDLAPVLAAGPWLQRHAGAADIRYTGRVAPIAVEAGLNEQILHDARAALAARGPVTLHYAIRNGDRSVGARLSGEIGQLYGDKGLPSGTVKIQFRGNAGQSFGVFNAPGVELYLTGDANDYVGKGMAGGLIAIRPDPSARFAWHENIIAGNTLLYGATGGELYAAGQVGERFAVRNSGATAVVEGVGDHACEYMTGGVVLILGPTGRNFGAGMTGGVAYVLDEASTLRQRHNSQLVQLDRLTGQEESFVQQLIKRHLDITGSPYASELLSHWDVYRGLFWRVMPREAVAKIEAESEGTTGEAAKARAA
jgi:glutamate synthase (ferredoxin)